MTINPTEIRSIVARFKADGKIKVAQVAKIDFVTPRYEKYNAYRRKRYAERATAFKAIGLRFDGKPRVRKRWGIKLTTHAAYVAEWRRRKAAEQFNSTI